MTPTIAAARLVLDRFWDKSLPVDLPEIARGLGVNIEDTLGIDGDLDVSGKFFYKDDVPTCVISQADTIQRRRFTLAHELGHFVLGHGEQVDETETLYRGASGYTSHLKSIEVDANAFAAELIMPKIAIDYCIEKENITSIDSLSKLFVVSQIAMEYRLKNTGWLN